MLHFVRISIQVRTLHRFIQAGLIIDVRRLKRVGMSVSGLQSWYRSRLIYLCPH